LQNKKVVVKGFKDVNWAIKEYHECVDMMNEYGKLPKEDFIKAMKKAHPQKYKA
jgi:inorganic pyrophosphatase